MSKEDERTRASSLRKIFLGSHVRPEREEKVLRYVIHRTNEGAPLHDVVGEDYVRRNCSPDKVHEITNDPKFVHACRQHLWQTFRSGELDPSWGRGTSWPPTNYSPAHGEDASGPDLPSA